ncbi:MAG: zinc-ribbon domain containing protein [Clostridiales bacterium]|nr:zinc-ribbon domain containing protein [Clostridiales bacterium]
MYEDKMLTCINCGNEFAFTAGEQEFYAEKGLTNAPSRCKDCRTARKKANRAARENYETVCAQCGKTAVVPFIPKSDKPIYCSECYADKQT